MTDRMFSMLVILFYYYVFIKQKKVWTKTDLNICALDVWRNIDMITRNVIHAVKIFVFLVAIGSTMVIVVMRVKSTHKK